MANVPRVINLASSLLLKSAPYPVRSLIFIANLDFTNPFRVEEQYPSVQLQAFRSRSDWHSESPIPIQGTDLPGANEPLSLPQGRALRARKPRPGNSEVFVLIFLKLSYRL